MTGQDVFAYRRIIVLGNNGSGKSYFSGELAAITGLPLTHLDSVFWGPNWEKPTKEAWREKNIELIAAERWILDGLCSHGGTVALRFAAADAIIFLDISRLVCLAGVIKRNGKARPDTTQYPYERFDRRFFQLCKGIWTFPGTRKRMIIGLHEKFQDKPFLRIESRSAMRKLLDQWRKKA